MIEIEQHWISFFYDYILINQWYGNLDLRFNDYIPSYIIVYITQYILTSSSIQAMFRRKIALTTVIDAGKAIFTLKIQRDFIGISF